MSRCLPVLSEEEFQTLVEIIDAGVRAAGLNCILRLAPVVEKLLKAQEVVDIPLTETAEE